MEDLSEKEQLDALRAWWSENGSYVMGGVIVGIIVIFGWNSWQTNIADTEIAASTLYEDVMEAVGRGNLDTATTAADQIFSNFSGTPYEGQARLAMARMYMDNGRDQDAAEVLTPLARSTSLSELSLVGRLRLAKILLYQNKADEVVSLMINQPETAFSARFSEVLGDAYVALGSYSEAEAAYIAALNDNPSVPTVDASLVRLKINDLPVPGEEEAAEDESSEAEGTGNEAPAAEDPQVEDAGPTADEPSSDAVEESEPGEL